MNALRSGKVILSCEGVSCSPVWGRLPVRTFGVGRGSSPVPGRRKIGIVVAAVTGGLKGTMRVDLEGRETFSRMVSFFGAGASEADPGGAATTGRGTPGWGECGEPSAILSFYAFKRKLVNQIFHNLSAFQPRESPQ